jgi:hypothetical protein
MPPTGQLFLRHLSIACSTAPATIALPRDAAAAMPPAVVDFFRPPDDWVSMARSPGGQRAVATATGAKVRVGPAVGEHRLHMRDACGAGESNLGWIDHFAGGHGWTLRANTIDFCTRVEMFPGRDPRNAP